MTQVTGYMRRLEDLTVMMNFWEKTNHEEQEETRAADALKLVGICYINIIHFLPAGVRTQSPRT